MGIGPSGFGGGGGGCAGRPLAREHVPPEPKAQAPAGASDYLGPY